LVDIILNEKALQTLLHMMREERKIRNSMVLVQFVLQLVAVVAVFAS